MKYSCCLCSVQFSGYLQQRSKSTVHHYLLHHGADICGLFFCFIPFHVYPTSLQSFLDFPSNSCVYIFLLQLFPSHPTQANFQVIAFRNLQFHQKDTVFLLVCLFGTLVTHATFLSRHSEAGLVFPLKQISNSNDSCYHLEINYVPGTVLNTRSIVTLLLP